MANKRIDMLEIKQIIQLKAKGVSNREISRRLIINRKTVDQYVHYFNHLDVDIKQLTSYTEAQLQELFPRHNKSPNDKRLSQLKDYYPQLEKDGKAVGATKLELWRQYKNKYPDGYSYTHFKTYLKQWSEKPDYSMHMQHKFGDKLFVDYAGKSLRSWISKPVSLYRWKYL